VQLDPVLLRVAAVADEPARDRDVAVTEQEQRIGGESVAAGAAGLEVSAW
jgi:hypothetical protein